MEITAFNPVSSSADRKLRRPVLMLKDYLLDDLSSCSSSGFKSFPRRPQCCPSTVRFLIDVDLKARPGDVPLQPRRSSSFGSSSRFTRDRPSLKRCPSKAAVSALRRASMKVINAVKLLTFPSAAKSAPAGQSKPRRSLLPRSLSRKLLSRRFWRRSVPEEPEMGQWRVFRNILAEKDLPPDSPPPPANATSAARDSTSSSSGRNGGSSSWDSSEFGAVDTVSTSSGNSVSPVVSTKKDLLLPPKLGDHPQVNHEEKVSGRVGVSVGGIEVEEEEDESPESTPTAASSKEWPNEEKEQLSPVSVLDCPFKDDEEVSSTSEYSPIHVGGARKKHGRKSHRVKSLSQLEPLNLDQRLALSEKRDGLTESTLQPYASLSSTEYVEENEISLKAEDLLEAIKINNPCIGLEEDNLLSDFFIEKMESGRVPELEALELAEDWLTGSPQELWTGWEVKAGRTAYLRDMEEKCGSWTNLKEEQQEVAAELEVEVWSSLMEEIFLDL